MRAVPIAALAALISIPLSSTPGMARANDRHAPPGGVVRCESDDGRTRECPVDARGGVRLLRQLSRSECVEGRTWGSVRDAIWVTGGCRGEFLVHGGYDHWPREPGRPPEGGEMLVRCESRDGRWTHCPADTRGGVELVRQRSRSACIRGQTWGADRRGVWVSGGCRGEFRAGGGGWHGGPDYGRFRCESNDGRARSCPLDVRGEVRLVRQLSRAPCIEGRSWGQDRRGVWVDHGCRAEFEVAPRWGR